MEFRTMTYNKLIAEFMGYENTGTLNNPMYEYYDNDFQDGSYKIKDLQYHKSWDWLMPVVVECFERFGNTDTIDYMKLNDALLTCNIEELYKTVVEFIKFYNQNK